LLPINRSAAPGCRHQTGEGCDFAAIVELAVKRFETQRAGDLRANAPSVAQHLIGSSSICVLLGWANGEHGALSNSMPALPYLVRLRVLRSQPRLPHRHRFTLTLSATVKTIFAQESAQEVRAQWKSVADALRKRVPKLAALMDASLDDVLAYTAFPKEHWPQISSTDDIDKQIANFPAIIVRHGRPRDEERRRDWF
jgi:hypothetical protein